MMIDHRDVVGVSDFAGNVSRWINLAAAGRDVFISKNNRVAVALVDLDRMQKLEDREENLALLALAMARTATDNGNRTDFEDFVAELGLTDEVAALDPAE